MIAGDFLIYALLCGIGVAAVAGPLGCFVVWRRMAYFGDSLAHSALLGIALGFLLSINLTLGIAITCVCFAVCIVGLQQQHRIATDTLLGILSHTALSIGLVALSFMETVRVDLIGYLFGDILAVTPSDIAIIYGGGAAVLVVFALIWRDLLAMTVHEELARAEGVATVRTRLIFTLLLAVVIAISMKIVGILLITSMLIIPAATARRFTATPERMALTASAVGALSVALGLLASLQWDTPSGPSVVCAAFALFLCSLAVGRGRPKLMATR
ncbi:MAG: metal ABC transporter permease [Alphaproteobacteria bacterium]|nr:metal ABC transporter permease [Alphaproteobacteria bacterium]